MTTVTATRGAGARVPDRGVYELPRLRAWREYTGMTRSVLASETEVSVSMLLIIEMRGQRASGRVLNRIAETLGVPAPVLLAYGPLDREARPWATRAVKAAAARRLASVS